MEGGFGDPIWVVEDWWLPDLNSFEIFDPPLLPEDFHMLKLWLPCGNSNVDFIITQLFG